MIKTFSRYNYVHVNKGNITIGIKGQVKQVFPKSDLGGYVAKIQNQSVRLSQRYTSNAKFPSDLGLSGETSEVMAREVSVLSSIYEGDSVDPANALRNLSRLKKLATNKAEFEREYYNQVNKYYGTNFTVKETKARLKKGLFRGTIFDIGKYPQSDPTRLQDWITDKLNEKKKGKNIKKSYKTIQKIDDIEMLKIISSEVELGNVSTLREVRETYRGIK